MLTRICGLFCLLTGFAVALGAPALASEPRIALVIGNSNYGPEIGRLLNPANDAKLMASTLQGLGFSVDLVLDADQKAMKRAVKGFGSKLREAGNDATGLFYYAGHGVQVDGTNFLLPVGAEIGVEADVEIESISADDVMTQMQSAGNAVNLVFLDACRNNPLAASSRSATRGLARLDAPRGSFVGYSTAPGDVAADGDGANSPYAIALAEELGKPGISIEEAHRNVRSIVLARTGNKQTPWDSSSLTGAVILKQKAPEPTPEPVAVAAPQPQPQASQQAAVDKEAMFWDAIKESQDPAEFEAYLQQYPQGSFAPLARTKVAKLKTEQPAAHSAIVEPSVPSTGAAPALTLKVTPEVKAEIDDYLRRISEDTTASAWAVAIANDGSRVAVAKCGQTSGARCWGGWRDKVNRLAVNECGGAGACFLLYENGRRVANTEIATE